MINKNSGLEISIQPEDPQSRTTSHWLLPWPQSKIAMLPPGISGDCTWELSSPILNFFLGPRLKVCNTVIKGMYHPVSMAASVANRD